MGVTIDHFNPKISVPVLYVITLYANNIYKKLIQEIYILHYITFLWKNACALGSCNHSFL